MKNYTWAVIYGVILTGFTVFVALDTFVISRVYSTVPISADSDINGNNSDINNSSNSNDNANNNGGFNDFNNNNNNGGFDNSTNDNTDNNSGFDNNANDDNNSTGNNSSPVVTENSYKDNNISITLTEHREHDTTIYCADIQLSSPEYLKTALAKNSYGKNVTEKTSAMAEDNNAILAVNGDYYGAQERGYVLRNGLLYRENSAGDKEDLVIYNNGNFEIINEMNVSAKDLLNAGAQQILSFGPGLVINGEIDVTESEEVGKAKSSNPRTAIGMIDNLHYLLVVSDGRTSESEGLSLYELAAFMKNAGAKTAYNLDGGGSSTMYFNGEVVNNPTSNGRTIKERSVSDIVYIGY